MKTSSRFGPSHLLPDRPTSFTIFFADHRPAQASVQVHLQAYSAPRSTSVRVRCHHPRLAGWLWLILGPVLHSVQKAPQPDYHILCTSITSKNKQYHHLQDVLCSAKRRCELGDAYPSSQLERMGMPC